LDELVLMYGLCCLLVDQSFLLEFICDSVGILRGQLGSDETSKNIKKTSNDKSHESSRA